MLINDLLSNPNLCVTFTIDYKLNELNDQQEGINNPQGWNAIPSHDIMVPVPIKMQPSMGMLDPNNHQINNSSQHQSVIHTVPHQSVIHTSPQTPHVSVG